MAIALTQLNKQNKMTATVETLDRASASVADIALRFPHAIDILNKHHLDYCCNGKKLFDDVCKRNNLDPEQIWQEVQYTNGGSSAGKSDRFESWNLTLLVDYIVMNHHVYVTSAIPEIKGLLDKVCSAHGDDQPYLLGVREKFNSLSEELLSHMPKEEQLLFPAIKRIEQNTLHTKDSFSADNLTIPIMVMEHEHEVAGDLVKSIRTLTNNFMPPAFACPTFLITYKMLQEFDNDLMQHIHLENNILFPKAQLLSQN